MCAGERAEGDTEEAASALDDAERALETMRLLGAELEDEAGDAEAGSSDFGSGLLEEDASSSADASGDEVTRRSRADLCGDATAVRTRASFAAPASGVGLPSHSSASSEPPSETGVPGTGPSSGARPGKRERVGNFLRRARGLRALTDEEMLAAHSAKEAKKADARRKKAASKAARRRARADALEKRASRNSRKRRKDPYEALRGGFDKKKLRAFFNRRPGSVATRLASVIRVGARVVRLWRKEEKLEPSRRTRGAALRDALSGLGPVFVKIGQTLSQRPDLIGDEAADALKSL